MLQLRAHGGTEYAKAFQKAFQLMASVDEENEFEKQERGDYTS